MLDFEKINDLADRVFNNDKRNYGKTASNLISEFNELIYFRTMSESLYNNSYDRESLVYFFKKKLENELNIFDYINYKGTSFTVPQKTNEKILNSYLGDDLFIDIKEMIFSDKKESDLLFQKDVFLSEIKKNKENLRNILLSNKKFKKSLSENKYVPSYVKEESKMIFLNSLKKYFMKKKCDARVINLLNNMANTKYKEEVDDWSYEGLDDEPSCIKEVKKYSLLDVYLKNICAYYPKKKFDGFFSGFNSCINFEGKYADEGFNLVKNKHSGFLLLKEHSDNILAQIPFVEVENEKGRGLYFANMLNDDILKGFSSWEKLVVDLVKETINLNPGRWDFVGFEANSFKPGANSHLVKYVADEVGLTEGKDYNFIFDSVKKSFMFKKIKSEFLETKFLFSDDVSGKLFLEGPIPNLNYEFNEGHFFIEKDKTYFINTIDIM